MSSRQQALVDQTHFQNGRRTDGDPMPAGWCPKPAKHRHRYGTAWSS